MRQKPAPKSVKESRSISNHASLSEFTTSDSDGEQTSSDNSQVQRKTPFRATKKSVNKDPAGIRSLDKDSNVTDYDLAFSCSRIQNPTLQRCSTLNSNKENVTASTSAKHSQQKGMPGKANKEQTNKAKVQKQKLTAGSVKKPTQVVTNRRKQNPLHRELRFSKEVNALQKPAPKSVKESNNASLSEFTTSDRDGEQTSSDNSQLENVTASTSAKHSQQKGMPGEANKERTNKAKVQKQKITAGSVKKPTQVVTNRRKQNPLHRELRFWKEVDALQKRETNLIPMLPFSRLVRELMLAASIDVKKVTPTAMEALQVASELYITQRLQDAYLLTLHRQRITLDVKDLQILKFLRID